MLEDYTLYVVLSEFLNSIRLLIIIEELVLRMTQS